MSSLLRGTPLTLQGRLLVEGWKNYASMPEVADLLQDLEETVDAGISPTDIIMLGDSGAGKSYLIQLLNMASHVDPERFDSGQIQMLRRAPMRQLT